MRELDDYVNSNEEASVEELTEKLEEAQGLTIGPIIAKYGVEGSGGGEPPAAAMQMRAVRVQLARLCSKQPRFELAFVFCASVLQTARSWA